MREIFPFIETDPGFSAAAGKDVIIEGWGGLGIAPGGGTGTIEGVRD